MKKIYLAGKFSHLYALVDDEDYKEMSKISWILHEKGYAVNPQVGRMHRMIMKAPKGMQVDHKHGNKLDNRKSELRLCTNRQNHYNKGLRKDNKSGIKGVRWNKLCQKYEAFIKLPSKKKHLGTFEKIEDAIKARQIAEKKLHGNFAYQNS